MFDVSEHLLCSGTSNMMVWGEPMPSDRLTAAHRSRHSRSPQPDPSGQPLPGKRLRFWGTAYALLILLTGTNLPTPLCKGYETRFGFSPLVVTPIFAAYVAVLIPSLLVAGPVSDALGRRSVLLPAVVVAALGSLVFALATSTGWLFAARALQGLALGAASGSLTAALTELEPVGNRRKAALVSTVASVGGLGLGPVLAGLLAQYAPAPDVLPFVVEIALLVPAACSSSPERATPHRPPRRRPSVAAPPTGSHEWPFRRASRGAAPGRPGPQGQLSVA
ncbi:MFS transporter [Microtetraspora malaysiensis]|uniref:MFS transporter n=1 Tax=Microtetraspora malaysiensis TaxID=161358 RepID=UPI003D8FF54F